jgi:hypothetical protein
MAAGDFHATPLSAETSFALRDYAFIAEGVRCMPSLDRRNNNGRQWKHSLIAQ